jgi:putative ABC transport system permease protein
MTLQTSLFILALVAILAILGSGLLRPILLSMAWRNALRRPRQTAMVVAGLMIGTAIVSGALVTGDSMNYSIQKATYDSFGEIDETVILEGFNFFPEYVADELAADGRIRQVADGVAPQAIWDASVTTPRTGLYEPRVRMIGFDPARDEPFGPFRDGKRAFFADDLAPSEVILTKALAKRLDAQPGDLIALNYSRPLDPILPSFLNISSTVTTTGSALPPPLGNQSVNPVTIRFGVEASAIKMVAGIAWASSSQDLDVEIRDPSGRLVAFDRDGATNAPDSPVLLWVNGSVDKPLAVGSWSLIVDAKVAVNQSFQGGILTLYAEYRLDVIQKRLQEFEQQRPPPILDHFIPQVERRTANLTVKDVTDGGKGLQFLEPATMFMRLDTLQGMLDRPRQINIIRVTNPGGVEDGPKTAHIVYPALWQSLNLTKQRHQDSAAVQALVVQNDKVFWLHQAETAGDLFATFLSFISSFSVIAGLLLIMNIFTMLAEERKGELGISRAVGLRRGHLVRVFTYEGTVYALLAATLGTFMGLGIAALVVSGFNAFVDPARFPTVPFRVETPSLLLAFAIGSLLTIGTILIASWRSSHVNIVRAIRQLDEPEILKSRLNLGFALVIAVAGTAGTAYALATDSFSYQVVGPTLLAIGLALLLRRRIARKIVYPVVAAALLAYLTTTLFLITEYDRESGNIFGPVRAIIMALCLGVIVLYNEALTKGLASLLGRMKSLRAVARTAMSYPLHKKFRTGITLTMFSVILLMVSLFSIFGNLFATDPSRQMGGYDLRGETTQDVETLAAHGADPRALAAVAYYDTIPFFFKIGGDLVAVDGQTTGQFGRPQDAIWGIDQDFASRNQFRLIFRDAAFATDADAYRAVAANSSLAIVSYQYSTNQRGEDFSHDVGSELDIFARGGVHKMRIVGIQEQTHFKGVFVKKSLVKELFTNQDTLFLFKLNSDAPREATAKALESNFRDIGLDVTDLRLEILEKQKQFRQILSMVQVFLGMGLVVGVMSLGIVTARSVVERRQEIGMMRALGFQRFHVRRTFLVEMLTTITLGVVIGTAIAILVAFGTWTALLKDFDVPFTVPWLDLAIIAAVAYVATTLATLGPILRAARTPPAEALRYIE